jgi:hypothetical protein
MATGQAISAALNQFRLDWLKLKNPPKPGASEHELIPLADG